MKQMIPLAGIVFLGGLLPAQEQDPLPPRDAKAEYAALTAEIRQARQDYLTKLRQQLAEAKKSGKRPMTRSIRMSPDLKPFIPKFQDAADKYKGTDDAVQFLFWLVGSSGNKPAARQALATMGEKHAKSPALAKIAGRFGTLQRAVGKSAADEFLATLRQHNTDPNVHGHLALIELGGVIDKADLASDEYQQARSKLNNAIVKASDGRLKTSIKSRIELRERYGVGATAPDIEGVDIDGAAFKLSDYKGKIIFLDFWGDW